MRNGIKIRFSKGSAGSRPTARTNFFSVRLLTDEDQKRATSIAYGKMFFASLINCSFWNLCSFIQNTEPTPSVPTQFF